MMPPRDEWHVQIHYVRRDADYTTHPINKASFVVVDGAMSTERMLDMIAKRTQTLCIQLMEERQNG
jgi:hypothetical protein